MTSSVSCAMVDPTQNAFPHNVFNFLTFSSSALIRAHSSSSSLFAVILGANAPSGPLRNTCFRYISQGPGSFRANRSRFQEGMAHSRTQQTWAADTPLPASCTPSSYTRRPRRRWMDNNKMDLSETGLDWCGSGYGPVEGSFEHGI
jgi:hypothetical protein